MNKSDGIFPILVILLSEYHTNPGLSTRFIHDNSRISRNYKFKLRVIQGGHNVSEQDIKRRFERSWVNFNEQYKSLADSWTVFDTSGKKPVILDESE